jgi:hypothetical protein
MATWSLGINIANSVQQILPLLLVDINTTRATYYGIAYMQLRILLGINLYEQHAF